jgi:hypothetical protein
MIETKDLKDFLWYPQNWVILSFVSYVAFSVYSPCTPKWQKFVYFTLYQPKVIKLLYPKASWNHLQFSVTKIILWKSLRQTLPGIILFYINVWEMFVLKMCCLLFILWEKNEYSFGHKVLLIYSEQMLASLLQIFCKITSRECNIQL